MVTLSPNPVTDSEIEKFRAAVEQLCNDAWKAAGFRYAAGIKIVVNPGNRYARLSRYEVNADGTRWGSSESVHCFVDRTNGNILKPAGWKSPVTKNPRGNIRDENPLAGVTQYGVKYLR